MNQEPDHLPDQTARERRRAHYRPAMRLAGATALTAAAAWVEPRIGLPTQGTYTLVQLLALSTAAAGVGGVVLDLTDRHSAR